tara:strand:+ start:8148 stop:8414 length:267 start_codon:yes stop_codon:yes gene_type:complete
MQLFKHQVKISIYIKEIDESVSFVVDYMNLPYRSSTLLDPEEGGIEISDITLEDDTITSKEKEIVKSLLFNNKLYDIVLEHINNTHED